MKVLRGDNSIKGSEALGWFKVLNLLCASFGGKNWDAPVLGIVLYMNASQGN